MSLLDARQRPLRDLRISVTDRCNFRCTYCMPKELFGPDHAFLQRTELLSYEEITRLARIFVAHGVEKIRLTGGEPLVRRDLHTLIAQLHSERGTLRLERHAAIARSMARSVAARSEEAPAQEHLRDLVDRLFACEVPYWTPDGKPTLITFGLDELAQRFDRG